MTIRSTKILATLGVALGATTVLLATSSEAQPPVAPPAPTVPGFVTHTFPDAKATHGLHHVFGYAGDDKVFFRGFLQVDADGSPRTYHVGMTCTDGENDWNHEVVNCANVHNLATCAHTRGFDKHAPHWGQAGQVVHCKVDGHKCVDGETKAVTCSMTPHANSGLDNLANGGRPGDLYGLAARSNGKLCIINDDANGGHYISPTAWNRNRASNAASKPAGWHWDPCEPTNYVNSEAINYLAMPSGMTHVKIHQGDIFAVANWDTNKIAFAIYGDAGGKVGALGEGSIALAKALGTQSDPKGRVTLPGEKMPHDGLGYVAFPNSHQLVVWPLSQAQIDAEGRKLLDAWGGDAKFKTATATLPRPRD